MLRPCYYRTSSGRCPVRDYIESLDDDLRARIKNALLSLCEEHPRVLTVSIKHLPRELWEVRVTGRNRSQHRILYAVAGERLLLLHAFTKKSQRTPQREIETAARRLSDLRRWGDS